MFEWADKFIRGSKQQPSVTREPEVKPQQQYRRVALVPPKERFSPSHTFPRYEFFNNAETFALWFRTQKPDWIGINVANALYVDGVNVASSEWLARTKKGEKNGMILEIDPNLSIASRSIIRHTGNTEWARQYPGIQPLMVSALSGEVRGALAGKVDAAIVVAPAPLTRDAILSDTWNMLKPDGVLTSVMDPIISENTDEPGTLHADLPDILLKNCPGATDIHVNMKPYLPGQKPAFMSVADYLSRGPQLPETHYINHTGNWSAPVLVMQMTKS